MPTKKASKRSGSRPVPARSTTTAHVTEVFSTEPESTVPVERGSIRLYVNGQDKGDVDCRGKKLKEFVIAKASSYGIRTFSVYVDGAKADTSMGNKAMSTWLKVEIVAKDSRG